MLKLFFWLRYLRRKKIVLLSIAAVGLSVGLLIVVSSLFNSFIAAFRQSAVEVTGDVVVEPPVKFVRYHLFIQSLEKTEQIRAATASLSAHGLLHLGKGNVRAVNVLGIEPEKRAQVTGFKKFLLSQKKPLGKPIVKGDTAGGQTGFVGIGVVAEPDEKTDEYNLDAIQKDAVGRKVILTTGSGENLKRTSFAFSITDIVFTGIYDVDKSFVYLPVETLQDRLYPDQAVVADQVQIKLKAGVELDAALEKINTLWEDFASGVLGWNAYLINSTKIVTSGQMQSRYIAELKKQMGVLLFIFGIISLSTVLLIFCILYMIVETRLRDIAIIKSCGASGCSVISIFVGFGGCIGTVGSGLGIGLGYLITKNINSIENWIRIIFGLKLWKSSVYVFSQIPNQVHWQSVWSIVFLAVAAAAAGALIPAIVAARTQPVNILRYE